MIFFRRLTTDDAPLLAEIGGVSLLESHGHSAPPEVMQQYVQNNFSEEACANELADGNNLFYAVFYNNKAAGYYKIILNSPHEAVALNRATKMERLYLLKEYYALKLGKELLLHAVNLSKKGGDEGMWLTVWQKNDRALSFYKREGFTVVGEGKFTLTATRFNPTFIMQLAY